jgi:long-chain acyl-CoA synthetase
MLDRAIYDVREIKNFRDLIDQSVDLFGDEPAFKLKNVQGEYYDVSYKEFQQDIRALGTSLLARGKKGERIAVIGKNSYKWCTAYLAVASGIGIIVPIDKELQFEDINIMLKASKSTMIFADADAVNKLTQNKESLSSDLEIVSFDIEDDTQDLLSYNKMLRDGEDILNRGDKEYLKLHIDADALSVLLFTSGTSDKAKGVMLSQRNICFVVMSTSSIVDLGPGDRLLSVLPIHHTYECSLTFLTSMYNGACLAFSESLLKLMKNMQEVEPTVFVCVPLLLEKVHARILKAASEKRGGKLVLSIGKAITNAGNAFGVSLDDKIFKEIKKNFGGKIKKVIVGAAAVRPDVISDLKTFGIPALIGYGLTECAPLVSGNNDELFTPDTVGRPIPGVEVKITNPDSSGIGEICVKSPGVMLGYYENDSATAEVIDEQGWFHTGDLGSIDDAGLIRITGRIKNVIVTKNGKNIYPEEVEFHLTKNPFIAEAMVIGSDDEEDTVVEAKIFPDVNAIAEKLKLQTATVEDITRAIGDVIKEVNKKLPKYKSIKKFNIRDSEFVKTTTAKIKRYSNMDDNK